MKYISVIVLLLVTISLNAQKRFSIGAYGGLGKSFNIETGYNSVDDPKSLLDYNYGLSLCLRIKDSTRIRVEGSIYRTGLKYDWPTPTAGGVHPVKTVKNVYFWDITLRYDYKFFVYKKLDFYLSPGAKGLFSMGYSEETENSVGNTKSSNYLDFAYTQKLVAPSVQLLLRYKLSKHWGITLAPEYSYYFRKFYYTCNGSLSQFDVKLGMECNF